MPKLFRKFSLRAIFSPRISRLRRGSLQALAHSPRLILSINLAKTSIGGLNLRPQRNQKAKYKYKANKKEYQNLRRRRRLRDCGYKSDPKQAWSPHKRQLKEILDFYDGGSVGDADIFYLLKAASQTL